MSLRYNPNKKQSQSAKYCGGGGAFADALASALKFIYDTSFSSVILCPFARRFDNTNMWTIIKQSINAFILNLS